jgi:hypothetical protein
MDPEEKTPEWYEGQIEMLQGAIEGWRSENDRLTAELAEANRRYTEERKAYASMMSKIVVRTGVDVPLGGMGVDVPLGGMTALQAVKSLRDQLAEARGHIEWLNAWLLKHHGTCDPDALRAWGQIRAAIDAGKNDAGTSVRPADLGE